MKNQGIWGDKGRVEKIIQDKKVYLKLFSYLVIDNGYPVKYTKRVENKLWGIIWNGVMRILKTENYLMMRGI